MTGGDGQAVTSLPGGYVYSLLAAGLFGAAIVPAYGAYSEVAIAMVVMGLLLLAFALLGHLKKAAAVQISARASLPVLWVAVFGLAWMSASAPYPLVYPAGDWVTGGVVQAAFLIVLLTYLPALLSDRLAEWPAWRATRFAAIGLGVALLGWDVIRTSPEPFIDVWDLQQAATQSLAGGSNPYDTVTVENTAPGVSEDLPYVYPPLQLLVTLPAYLLGGDVRYAMLFALLVAGFALRFVARRGFLAGRRSLASRPEQMPAFAQDAPALVVWMTPMFAFLLEQAWIDPVQLALLCTAVATYVAGRGAIAALFFGLTLASKQTAFWLIALAAFCLRFTARQWVLAAAVALATVAPFALWEPVALYESAVGYVGRLPARADALTLPNWSMRHVGTPAWGGLAFPLAALIVATAAWRLRRSVAGFTAAAALTYGVFFAFNKFAFANYWFLVVGLSALAAAAALHGDIDAETRADRTGVELKDGTV